MENTELIERYVTGRMSGAERDAFENQLQADSSLQGDVAMQKQIVEGIKQARMTELKTMLSQVPVGGMAGAGGAASVQVVTGIVTVAAIVTGALFYTKPWEKGKPVTVVVEKPAVVPQTKTEPSVSVVDPKEEKTTTPKTELRKEPKVKAAHPISKSARPKIEVVDPTAELSKEPSTEKARTDVPQSAVVASRIAVETDASNAKYSFHYQFVTGKLILYGSFDKGLYEILEVNGDTHSVFLYYKDEYYLLNEKQAVVTPLTQIKDTQLVSKLKAFRGQ